MRNMLAKLGLYLVNRFYVYKGETYTIHLGRLDRASIRPDERRQRAIEAWYRRSEKTKHNQKYNLPPFN